MKRVRLKNCPIGLFEYKGTICLKTEYSTDGYADCYTVDGGEVFWGENDITKEQRANLLVTSTGIEQIKSEVVAEKFAALKEKLSTLTCIDNDALNDIFECIDELQDKESKV